MPEEIRRFFRFPLVFLLVTPIVLYAPILFTGETVFWGTQITQFIPWWTQALETLKAGELPLWNPLNGMGAPLLANYQSALLYPPTWLIFGLALFVGNTALAWGQAILIVLHLIWAGIGMAALIKRLGWGELSQLVSGLAFSMSGYLVARTHFLSINLTVAWLPWIILATYQLVGSKRPKIDVLKLALLFGFQLLAGHAQTAWYTLLLAISWLLFWCWHTGKWFTIKRAGYHFGIALIVGVTLAAIQLIPTAEYLMQSHRAGAVDFERAMVYSFWPWRFLTLLLPNLFGSPATGDYWGYATYWEDAIYIGLLPVILVLFAILKSGKNMIDKRLVWFAGLTILLSFVLALGDNTPIFPWLYQFVPSFDMFQAPTRYSIWAVFGLALLAGMGTMHWRRPKGRGLYWSRLGVMAAFAVSLGASTGTFFLSANNAALPDIRPSFISAFALAGLIALFAGILNLTAPVKGNGDTSRAWMWAIVLLISIDLLIVNWGLNPGTDVDLFTSSPINLMEVQNKADGHRVYISSEEERQLKFDRFFSFETFALAEDWMNLRAVLLPNTNLLVGISSANNFDPLVPGRFDRWMDTLEESPSAIRAEMLDRMDVSLVEHPDPEASFGIRFDPVDGAARLRWVTCVKVVNSGEEALEIIASGEINSSDVVIERKLPAASPCKGEADAEISLVFESANRLVVQTNASTEGWLVLADVWYPGWEARVDGDVVNIFKADYLFRGVQVDAGQHTIKFLYRPLSFRVGVAVSLIAWVGLLWGWRRWK